MSRSCFALLALLVSLAGPLVFPRAARSEEQLLPTCPAEAYGVRSVCTPPSQPVHPADAYGLVPHPGYAEEHAAAEEAWRAPAPVEDWRDFVVENEPSSITNQYDDLFETMKEVATKTIDSSHAAVVEADEEAYQAESASAPPYDPYEANALDDHDPEYASIEAYESEFSGYGNTDYLRDNFDYEPLGEAAPRRGLFVTRLARSWTLAALDSELVTSAVAQGNDLWFDARELSSSCSLDTIIDHSELAWDRLEEYRRLTSPPIPKLESEEQGYRLAGDDCGWDCWYSLGGGEPAASPAPVVAGPDHNRETLRSVALSLRSLAGKLEAASDWVASLGGIDVAELKADATAR